uniref:G protein gamma domain-containing protein n=1 Tax=Panagrolaimus sp. PS1159 TaxID=55785 RepID=A0AC35GXS1_9BILA
MKSDQPKTVGEAKKIVQQLQREKNISRAPVSFVIEDLVKSVQAAQKDDPLYKGEVKENPYDPTVKIGLGGCLSVRISV